MICSLVLLAGYRSLTQRDTCAGTGEGGFMQCLAEMFMRHQNLELGTQLLQSVPIYYIASS